MFIYLYVSFCKFQMTIINSKRLQSLTTEGINNSENENEYDNENEQDVIADGDANHEQLGKLYINICMYYLSWEIEIHREFQEIKFIIDIPSYLSKMGMAFSQTCRC